MRASAVSVWRRGRGDSGPGCEPSRGCRWRADRRSRRPPARLPTRTAPAGRHLQKRVPSAGSATVLSAQHQRSSWRPSSRVWLEVHRAARVLAHSMPSCRHLHQHAGSASMRRCQPQLPFSKTRHAGSGPQQRPCQGNPAGTLSTLAARASGHARALAVGCDACRAVGPAARLAGDVDPHHKGAAYAHEPACAERPLPADVHPSERCLRGGTRTSTFASVRASAAESARFGAAALAGQLKPLCGSWRAALADRDARRCCRACLGWVGRHRPGLQPERWVLGAADRKDPPQLGVCGKQGSAAALVVAALRPCVAEVATRTGPSAARAAQPSHAAPAPVDATSASALCGSGECGGRRRRF